MAWIRYKDLAVNLDRVQTFWWEREDTFHAYLYLRYGPDNVVKLDDPFAALHIRTLQAVGLPWQT